MGIAKETFLQTQSASILAEFCSTKNNIYIYGAGALGIRCLDVMVNIIKKTPRAFLVSNKNDNPPFVNGISVEQYDDFELGNNDGIIIAMKEPMQGIIFNVLVEKIDANRIYRFSNDNAEDTSAEYGKVCRKHTVSAVVWGEGKKYEFRKALDSVFRQTVKVDEIIVVDKSDDDEIKKYIEALDRKDVLFHRIPQGEGFSDSKLREVGMNQSVFDYIAFLNARDVWNNKHIEAMLPQRDDIDIVISGYRHKVGLELKNYVNQNYSPEDIQKLAYIQYLFAPSATIVNRKTWKEKDYLDDFVVENLTEELSVHWSRARSTGYVIKEAFLAEYSEELSKHELAEKASLYLDSILF